MIPSLNKSDGIFKNRIIAKSTKKISTKQTDTDTDTETVITRKNHQSMQDKLITLTLWTDPRKIKIAGSVNLDKPRPVVTITIQIPTE